ncbi:hypothetical protein Drorol1_Dr00026816 [Drosera rotundifolia]
MVDILLLLFLHSSSKVQAANPGFRHIRCNNTTLCSKPRPKVILTNYNYNNFTGFVLNSRAFQAMANPCLGKNVSTLGVMDVEYKRIPCDYKNQTLAVRVEDFSKQPGYLAIKVLYQGGQADITRIVVAQIGTSNGASLKLNYGAVWDTSSAPAGPLQLTSTVTSGVNGKSVVAQKALPANWQHGVIYDTGSMFFCYLFFSVKCTGHP